MMSLLAVQVCAAVKPYSNRDPNESSHNDILCAKVKVTNMEKIGDKIKILLERGKKKQKLFGKLGRSKLKSFK